MLASEYIFNMDSPLANVKHTLLKYSKLKFILSAHDVTCPNRRVMGARILNKQVVNVCTVY